MKKKNQCCDVLLQERAFPNRSRGVELLPTPRDAVDIALEIFEEKNHRKRAHGRAIVTKGGLPGQVYRAKIGRTRGDAKEVELLELLERSPLEKPAKCPVDDRCGGCCYQTLSYETELMLKGRQLKDLFAAAGFSLPVPIQRSPLAEGYRNKMEYTFGDAVKEGPLVLGLHCPGHFHEIVDTVDCNIVPDDFNRLRAFTQHFFRVRQVPYYHRREKKGYLRHLVLRASLSEKELMVNLVTSSQRDPDEGLLREYVGALRRLALSFSLVSIFHTVNDSPADAVVPEKVDLLYGRPYLRERLCDLSFQVGPFSFFQPNTPGAEHLYQQALHFAGDLSGKTVYDLYSGTGTITQILAQKAQRAVGVEIVEEAVASAGRSAEQNGIANAKFLCRDVLDALDALAEGHDHAEVIVIDPPRAGIHPKALPKIAAAGAERIVYISCNPTTQVRDLQAFSEHGYRPVRAQAFDQFPRTKNVECVVLMSRK